MPPPIAGPRPSTQCYARCRLAAARAHRQRVKARTHPIRREVVLRPAWRAWRSRLSTKRKSTVLSRQCSHAFTFATGASARRRRTISKSIAWMLSRVGSLTPGSLVSRAKREAQCHADRLRLVLLDPKDEDAGVAAAVRVPVCCEHCPVSPDGIGGGHALGLLVVSGRIADELRHGGPHYAPMGP